MKKLTGSQLDFTLTQLIPLEQSLQLLPILEQRFIENYPDLDRAKGKRGAILIGDSNVAYHYSYGGYKGRPLIESTRAPISWELFPEIFALKQMIEPISQSTFNVCIIQRYPNGKVGIAPHRDKEIVSGTGKEGEKLLSGKIVGFSIGATRTLRLTPPAYLKQLEPIDVALTSGSLYQINPPTNDHWFHSIEKDQTNGVRYSLTFRYIRPTISSIDSEIDEKTTH